MDARQALAIELAQRAGLRIARDHEHAVDVQTKSSAIDLVTATDRAAEAIVLEGITAAFPGDGVLAEESGAREGSEDAPRWIVDPLDGTTNFAHGFPHFCVSIAVAEGDALRIGVVHDPLRRETFVARAGQGAWLIQDGRPKRRLAVTQTTDLERCLLATGFGYDRGTSQRTNLEEFARAMRRVRGVRRAGSAALDLAYVAAGRLDAYWEYGLQPWDWAAGLLLVREAGGEGTTLEGEPFALGAASLCVGNHRLLPALRGVLVSG
jgi:myo-inositol-1(or 4)-monophosphatase